MRRSFYSLLIGQVVSSFGDVLFSVCVISIVYTATNSILGSSTVLVVMTLGRVIGGLVASQIVDRFSHKQVMIWSDILRACLILGLFSINLKGDLSQISIYTVTGLVSFISSFFLPARSAVIPQITPARNLVRANSYLATSLQIIQTGGWAVAAPLISLIGSRTAILADAMTFVFSIVSLLFINYRKQPSISAANETAWSRIKHGWGPLWNNNVVRSLTLIDSTELFANTVWASSFMLAYTVQALHTSRDWWGFQGSAYFLGSIIGGIITSLLANWFSKIGGKVILWSSIAVALITFGYSTNHVPIVAVILSFLDGPMYQIRDVVQQSILQTNINYDVMARVFAAQSVVLSFLSAVALLVASVFAQHYGIAHSYTAAAIIYGIVAVAVAISKRIRSYQVPQTVEGSA